MKCRRVGKKAGGGNGGSVLSIAKMPAEVKYKFHFASSSNSSEHTAAAAAKECHSALHLYVSMFRACQSVR